MAMYAMLITNTINVYVCGEVMLNLDTTAFGAFTQIAKHLFR